MGLFSGIKKIGGNIKNAVTKGVKDVGHFAGDVASNPWVQGLTAAGLAATGVGAPAAAAIMAAERGGGALLKRGGNIGGALKGGLQGAAIGAGAGLAGQGIKKVLGRTAFDAAKGLFMGGDGKVHDPEGNTVYDENGEPMTELPEGGGDIGADDIGADDVGGEGGDLEAARHEDQNWLGKINDIATKVPGVKALEGFVKDKAGNIIGGGDGGGGLDWGKLGAMGLGAAQMANAAGLQKQSTQYAKDALAGNQANYATREPLRVAGLQGMLNPKTQDLSGLLSNSGPYAVGLLPNMPAKKAVTGMGSYV